MRYALEKVGVALKGHTLLSDVTFAVTPGERVVLLGVNGCGKTTLLKLLNGLMFPTSGVLRYDGQPLSASRLEQASFRRQFRGEVGLLFQNVDAMLFNPTVYDEIAFGPRQLGLADVPQRVAHWAERFELAPMLLRPPFELSGGEKKRVALAAMLALGPKVLLLDEPTANLDPASAAHLVDFLAGLADITVLVSTQNLSMVEELGSRAVLLAGDRSGILYDGPATTLVNDAALLVQSGLAHRHRHHHGAEEHVHFHVHDAG